MKTLLTTFILALLLSGCSVVNMTKGPEDYARNWYAKDLQDTYDRGIAGELAKAPPTGYATQPYHPDQWVKWWNDRIYYLLEGDLPQGYVGPTQKEFFEYIIQKRREAGLPELEFNERTKAIIQKVVTPQ
ncbi:MAG: hypothetical protein AAF546_12605 [Verrucomicrobiota bacterium]